MADTYVPKRLITLKQAARRLAVQLGTLYKWKCAGLNLELFYKIGGGLKVDLELLEEYMRKGRCAALPSDKAKLSD